MLITLTSFIMGMYVSQEYPNYVPNIKYLINCIKHVVVNAMIKNTKTN